MTWKDRILAGSFRGVPFAVESSDGELGRRIALHEYPQRDKPYPEDMGKKAGPISLEFFVHGADYMTFRDRMNDALNQSGSGLLVHPYRGQMTVTVLDARGPRETTREGGMARYSVTFIESGEPLFPSVVGDNGDQMRTAADIAAEQIKREFSVATPGEQVPAFDVTGPAWVAEESVSLLDEIGATIRTIQESIPQLPESVTGFVADLQGLATDVETLIRTPADLAGQIYGLIADLALLPDRPLRALAAYRQLWDVLTDNPAVSATTPSRTKQADNQAALTNLVQRAAVVEAARAVAIGGGDFASYDEAISARDELAEQLDLQMESAGDPVYAALADLRAGLVRYVAANAGNLARINSYTPPQTMPALVIAHRLYGDATREAEIVARNNFRHPGFVSGGVAIEVLADA